MKDEAAMCGLEQIDEARRPGEGIVQELEREWRSNPALAFA